jgi:hypothetical protein
VGPKEGEGKEGGVGEERDEKPGNCVFASSRRRVPRENSMAEGGKVQSVPGSPAGINPSRGRSKLEEKVSSNPVMMIHERLQLIFFFENVEAS